MASTKVAIQAAIAPVGVSQLATKASFAAHARVAPAKVGHCPILSSNVQNQVYFIIFTTPNMYFYAAFGS